MLGLSVVATALLVAGGVALLNLFNPRALRLMLAFLEQDSELHSLVSRSQLWQYSFDQFMITPIRGQGAGQPIMIFYRSQPVPHSHNVLLDYLRTLGAPGCAGLLVILATAVGTSVAMTIAALRARGAEPKHRILSIGLGVGCLSYIAANMSSDSMGPSTSPFFWLVLFLGLAARPLLRPSSAR
jgi:O-antigen ligase